MSDLRSAQNRTVDFLLEVGCTGEHAVNVAAAWSSGSVENLTDTERQTFEWLSEQDEPFL